MIGTILALLCGFLLLIPAPLLKPLAYMTGHTGLDFLLHSYSILTCALLHANMPHYIYNMFWLVPSCWYLEEKVGKKSTAHLCIATAAASTLLWQLCYSLSLQHLLLAQLGLPDPQGLIGASGMAAGTTAAALVVLGETEPKYSFVCYLLLACMLVCQIADACYGQVAGAQVAYWGHVGGMLMALFFAPSLCRQAQLK